VNGRSTPRGQTRQLESSCTTDKNFGKRKQR
jgi:hypothetical protein